MKLKSLLYGVIAGSTIAGVATLLVTPKSGEELQTSLMESVNKVRKNLQATKEHSISLSKQFAETAKISKETIEIVSKEVKESVNDWKQEVEPALIQLQKEIEDLQNAIENNRLV